MSVVRRGDQGRLGLLRRTVAADNARATALDQASISVVRRGQHARVGLVADLRRADRCDTQRPQSEKDGSAVPWRRRGAERTRKDAPTAPKPSAHAGSQVSPGERVAEPQAPPRAAPPADGSGTKQRDCGRTGLISASASEESSWTSRRGVAIPRRAFVEIRAACYALALVVRALLPRASTIRVRPPSRRSSQVRLKYWCAGRSGWRSARVAVTALQRAFALFGTLVWLAVLVVAPRFSGGPSSVDLLPLAR